MSLEIIWPAEKDKQPRLSKMRDGMIEPARYDNGDILRVADYESLDAKSFFSAAGPFNPDKRIKIEDWVKVLIKDNGVSFYAWRHIETNLIFI